MVALVVGGRHPGHYFLDSDDFNDVVTRFFFSLSLLLAIYSSSSHLIWQDERLSGENQPSRGCCQTSRGNCQVNCREWNRLHWLNMLLTNIRPSCSSAMWTEVCSCVEVEVAQCFMETVSGFFSFFKTKRSVEWTSLWPFLICSELIHVWR